MKARMFLIVLVSIVLLISACDKRSEEVTSMKDLKVSRDFTFQTVKQVVLNLNSVDTAKAAVPRAEFRLYRANDITLINAKTNSEGLFEHKLTVPAGESQLYLVADGVVHTLQIPSDGQINFEFTGTSTKSKDVSSWAYYPGWGEYFTLWYEDLWPTNGDYDVNDLVIDVNVEEQYDDDWNLFNLKFTYKVRAIGARRTIGFATTLPDYIIATGVPTSDNGLASWNGDYNTIVFFNNARDAVNDISSEFFNTDHEQPHIESDFVEINLPVTEDWGKVNSSKVAVWIPWYSAPYNPFIFINHDQSYQIHFKNYPVNPAYMNMAMFNTYDDNSNMTYPSWPESFQNENNVPWAFIMPASTPYPREKVSILKAFPRFANWALSDGYEDWDWYEYPDANYIYNPNH